MKRDFAQIAWDDALVADCRALIRLAVQEDLGRGLDLTTVSLVPRERVGSVDIVIRQAGVVAGLPVARLVLDEMDIRATWTNHVADGTVVPPDTCAATIVGCVRDLLTAERIMLNFLGRLSGIATGTRRYVDAIQGTSAHVYDTRKTTPGWRRLEKYAVRAGGGHNHRLGLHDAVLIKDNHLAFLRESRGAHAGPDEAVREARRFLAETPLPRGTAEPVIVEVEVDSLDQLRNALLADPDIVLLDNMPVARLREAVEIRDRAGSKAELEASGGVHLDTIRAIAETGVERISVGALTHSAVALDVALDWREA